MESVTSSNYGFREIGGRRCAALSKSWFVNLLDIMGSQTIPTHIQVMTTRLKGSTWCNMSFACITTGMSRYPSALQQHKFSMWVLVQVFSWHISFLTFIGRWALEVADQYPHVNVVGLDLAPIQPTYIPMNCEFQVADLTQDLAGIHGGSADLIHSR